MSHNFLFETYKFIEDRLEHINQELVKNSVDNTNRQYVAGRIDALCEIESFHGPDHHRLVGRQRNGQPVSTDQDGHVQHHDAQE